MIVREVVEAARDRLGDADGTGWTDTRLVRLVNAGQKDICKTTSVYRRKGYIGLLKSKTLYMLPNDCLDITRVEYMDEQLPIYSREDLDNVKTKPRRYAVKSNLNRALIEIHPAEESMLFFRGYIKGTHINDNDIPIDADNPTHVLVQPGEGVLASTNDRDNIEIRPDLGVMTGIKEDLTCHPHTHYGDICGSNLFTDIELELAIPPADMGVLVGFDLIPSFEHAGFLNKLNDNYVEGIYGICTEALFKETYVVVFYNAMPPKVEWLDGSLVIDDIWFDALVHYVVGNARQDDNDEGNYKIGELELSKYLAEVKIAKKVSAKSFNSQVTAVRETIYRRF